jgi:predicted N-formylglutamate amidohydrolase
MREKTLNKKPFFIFTVEHAGNQIPHALRAKIKIERNILNTHLAYDLGAYAVAKRLVKQHPGRLLLTKTTRLVVDTNRNIEKSRVFSRWSNSLMEEEKKSILKSYYYPHRINVLEAAKEALQEKKTVLLVSVHSFTPVFSGKRRATDIGILFRPRVEKELKFASTLKHTLKGLDPTLQVHFNRPYRGHTDCLSNDVSDLYLQNQQYLGVILELNQRLLSEDKGVQRISSLLGSAFSKITSPHDTPK